MLGFWCGEKRKKKKEEMSISPYCNAGTVRIERRVLAETWPAARHPTALKIAGDIRNCISMSLSKCQGARLFSTTF